MLVSFLLFQSGIDHFITELGSEEKTESNPDFVTVAKKEKKTQGKKVEMLCFHLNFGSHR